MAQENSNEQDDAHQKHVIVQVALRLFHEQGYGQVNLSQIAKTSGLSTKQVQGLFADKAEICHQVIDVYLKNQAAQFAKIDENTNPRQRLSLYLDSLVEDTDKLISKGCPMTNLYFDLRRSDKLLADHGAQTLQQRLDWIREQFVLITRVAKITDLPERLISATCGISTMAQVTGDKHLIRNQVNQLKSWIRSM